MADIHRNIKILGKVQGVFFRVSTQQKARSLNLVGIVRNEPDGTVYVEVEGPEDSVQKFIDWCEQGPTYAKVEAIDVTNGKVEGFVSFEIE